MTKRGPRHQSRPASPPQKIALPVDLPTDAVPAVTNPNINQSVAEAIAASNAREAIKADAERRVREAQIALKSLEERLRVKFIPFTGLRGFQPVADIVIEALP